MKDYRIILESSKTKNYLVTIAIGDKYYNDWKKYAYPLWKRYVKRYDLGIIVFIDNLIDKNSDYFKKATWQKLLIGDTLRDLEVENICYLDTDILINPFAPNVFENYKKNNIGIVSIRYNLPYNLDVILRRIAFYRHTYYDKSYPLDSALFISLEELYKYHNLESQEDEFCAGMFIFNKKHFDIMKQMFFKYPKSIDSITGGGDQTHVNYEFFKYGKIQYFDYKFQAIWNYEMAWKYPFLYSTFRNDKKVIKECVEASLMSNYFLHFAGSWYESEMWKIKGILEDKFEMLEKFDEYLKIPVTGKPKGIIKPQKGDN